MKKLFLLLSFLLISSLSFCNKVYQSQYNRVGLIKDHAINWIGESHDHIKIIVDADNQLLTIASTNILIFKMISYEKISNEMIIKAIDQELKNCTIQIKKNNILVIYRDIIISYEFIIPDV